MRIEIFVDKTTFLLLCMGEKKWGRAIMKQKIVIKYRVVWGSS